MFVRRYLWTSACAVIYEWSSTHSSSCIGWANLVVCLTAPHWVRVFCLNTVTPSQHSLLPILFSLSRFIFLLAWRFSLCRESSTSLCISVTNSWLIFHVSAIMYGLFNLLTWWIHILQNMDQCSSSYSTYESLTREYKGFSLSSLFSTWYQQRQLEVLVQPADHSKSLHSKV